MMKFVNFLLSSLSGKRNFSVEEGVKYSLKKYKKAYKLLEKYDQETAKDCQELADPEDLRSSIQEL